MPDIEGYVERITYYSAESGYTVLRLRPADSGSAQLITVVGTLPEVKPGEHLHLGGEWTKHPKYGSQFSASKLERLLPQDVEGIRRFLGSGLIKGIGPRTAEKIVAVFGSRTLEIIENEPERLSEVPGLPRNRQQLITAGWQEHKASSEAVVFFQQYGLSTNLALRVYRVYGEATLARVRENPYQLIRDIRGIGFKTADRIARALGLPQDAPARLQAGIQHALQQASEEGHVFLPESELLKTSAELLSIPSEQIRPALDHLSAEHAVIRDNEICVGEAAVYEHAQYAAERECAELLGQLIRSQSRLAGLTQLALAPSAQTPELSAEQQAALSMVWQHPVSILTGGPGTGKTTTLRALIELAERARHPYVLVSPTGRAAKRLTEATGRPAQTIHRLLGYTPNDGFKLNRSASLKAHLVVVDEASMLELALFHSLLEAVEPGTHLLLVGDVDQLPAVGAGDVLRDLVRSGCVPVTRLTQIYRQAEGSQIISNAHRINAGYMPDWSEPYGDFYFFGQENPEAAAELIVDIVDKRIPDKFGYDPLRDIQVLAPMYRGPAGVSNLNTLLQAQLNPEARNKPEHAFGERLWRVGDRVMQIRNNYDKEVFNGDIGRLCALDSEEQTLAVQFDDKTVPYDWLEVDELVHAYAISIHKAQGSEFPVVVVPLLTQHYVMLQRNLLYTAVTRARKLCILVGSRKAVAMAVHNNKTQQRWSGLAKRLNDVLPAELKV
ncbi:MAG: ATP-dependent RecD-like DNA helicase [Chloroflexi bacterium]|nr:ATP-dependent RecD-like DNA helicase [Chloroflexota bacterium]